MKNPRKPPRQPERDSTRHRYDILCVGEPLYELNQSGDDFRYEPGFGGDTSNCAVAAARQGASVVYFTALGKDVFGREFLKMWAREGVDSASVILRENSPTGLYLVSHGPEGHEFTYFRKDSAASLMRPEEIPADLIRSSALLHVSGISQAISDSASRAVLKAIDLARQQDVRVSYDPNLRLKLWPLNRAREVIHQAMALCDIALPGLEDAVQLTGLDEPQEMVKFYLNLGAEIVALSLGPDGMMLGTPDRVEKIGGWELKTVDATGAGDTFDGAFLTELVRGRLPFDAARYANAAAALSTTGYGAVSPMPRREEVEALLAGLDA